MSAGRITEVIASPKLWGVNCTVSMLCLEVLGLVRVLIATRDADLTFIQLFTTAEYCTVVDQELKKRKKDTIHAVKKGGEGGFGVLLSFFTTNEYFTEWWSRARTKWKENAHPPDKLLMKEIRYIRKLDTVCFNIAKCYTLWLCRPKTKYRLKKTLLNHFDHANNNKANKQTKWGAKELSYLVPEVSWCSSLLEEIKVIRIRKCSRRKDRWHRWKSVAEILVNAHNCSTLAWRWLGHNVRTLAGEGNVAFIAWRTERY